jgi:hypothetical protein
LGFDCFLASHAKSRSSWSFCSCCLVLINNSNGFNAVRTITVQTAQLNAKATSVLSANSSKDGIDSTISWVGRSVVGRNSCNHGWNDITSQTIARSGRTDDGSNPRGAFLMRSIDTLTRGWTLPIENAKLPPGQRICATTARMDPESLP